MHEGSLQRQPGPLGGHTPSTCGGAARLTLAGRTLTWELGGATRLIPGGAASAPEGGPMVDVMTRYGEPRALRGVPTTLRVRGALTGVSV